MLFKAHYVGALTPTRERACRETDRLFKKHQKVRSIDYKESKLKRHERQAKVNEALKLANETEEFRKVVEALNGSGAFVLTDGISVLRQKKLLLLGRSTTASVLCFRLAERVEARVRKQSAPSAQ